MSSVGFINSVLFYRDAIAAIDFLETAFGFTRRLVVRDDLGGVVHAELSFRDSTLMVSATNPARHWRSPLDLGGVNQSICVVVQDADAHHAQALRAGAVIVRELKDESYGGRGYEARDPEGHFWYFGTYVPGEWWDGNTPALQSPSVS